MKMPTVVDKIQKPFIDMIANDPYEDRNILMEERHLKVQEKQLALQKEELEIRRFEAFKKAELAYMDKLMQQRDGSHKD